jgi:hypothetical protein
MVCVDAGVELEKSDRTSRIVAGRVSIEDTP